MPRVPPELAALKDEGGDDAMTRLGQVANIARIDELGCGEWTVLYEYQHTSDESHCLYSALLSPARISAALEGSAWDAFIGRDTPGLSRRYDQGAELVTYDRFATDGIEPIIYVRDFHGIKPRQFDLSEEFRLFHNLYHDRRNDVYVHVDDGGREVVAAEIGPTCSRVLTRLLRQYMAARQLTLALYFDCNADADVNIEAANAAFPTLEVKSQDRRYSFHLGDVAGRTRSRLIGKKLIGPGPITESGVWPFEPTSQREYAEFIIDVAKDGSPIRHSCDPDALANYFGSNEDAPHYLTPVWFTRDVLSKYYADTIKFSVEDGYLRCGSLWGMQIDNNLPDHVVVYLGDLGRDLTHEEQIYWQHFNVSPKGAATSETNYGRSFLAQFMNPNASDLIFKQRYTALNEAWTEKFGWPIFRPLHEDDAHILKQFHVPVSENMSEFESQILFLVKLLIDSLNDSALTKALGGALRDEKSIGKFQRFLQQEKYPHTDRDIKLLRTLQSLRSSGAAHAKGEIFDKLKVKIGLDLDSPRDIFRGLLTNANQMLGDILAAKFG